MSAEKRIIVECPKCGALYDVNRGSLKPDLRFRCTKCRAVFPGKVGFGSRETASEQQIADWLQGPKEDD